MDPRTSGAGPLIAVAAGPAHRKIIQLVVSRNALIALTDKSEIWVLHGLDAVGSGTDAVPVKWRKLAIELPAEDVVAEPHATW